MSQVDTFYFSVLLFFMKTNFEILQLIYFQFEALNKQMMVFFRTRLGTNLISQKLS